MRTAKEKDGPHLGRLFFFQSTETDVNGHNTRPIWIAEQACDVGSNSEVWNQAREMTALILPKTWEESGLIH